MTRRNLFGLAAAAPAFLRAEDRKAAPAPYRFEPEASAPLARFAQGSRDPRLAVRASGALYMMAVTGGHGGARLALSTSSDGGDAFSPLTYISPEGAAVSSHGENSPTFGFSPGIEMYALWEQSTGKGIATDLMFARSPAFGRAWLPPIKVTDKTAPSTNAFSSMTVAPNGKIYCVGLDGRDADKHSPGTSSGYLARSVDGGKSFLPNQAIAHGVCPCCRPVAVADARGSVQVVWRGVYSGDHRDMALAVSSDGGETFGEARRVHEDGWSINGCPHSGATMVRAGNRLWMSWFSAGDGSNPGVRLAWSDDGGETFSKPSIVSAGVLDANHPAMDVADDGRILLVFQGRDTKRDNSWSPASAWLVEISPDGSTSAPAGAPGSAKSISYPRVVGGSEGRVAIAWTEDGQARLIRARRA